MVAIVAAGFALLILSVWIAGMVLSSGLDRIARALEKRNQ